MADTFIDNLDWVTDELITSTKFNQWWANMQNFHNGTALGDGIIVTRHLDQEVSDGLGTDIPSLLASLVTNPKYIQSGTSTIASGGSTITFPVSFDSTPNIIAIVRNTSDATPETVKITARSSSSFTARGFYGSTAAGVGIDWIAVNVNVLGIKEDV